MPAPSLPTHDAATEQVLIALVGATFPLTQGERSRPVPVVQDWNAVVESARLNGLTGLLWRAVEILAPHGLPDEVRDNLQDLYRRNALAQSLAYRTLASLASECAAAGIPLVLLKGAALAQTLYPASTLRPFGDVDVLVHRADAARVRDMLLARGLREAQVTYGFDPDAYGEMAFFATHAQNYGMDLHWQLVAPAYYRRRMPPEWFWTRTETLNIETQPMQVFQPTALLVHLAAHVGLHHQDDVRLIWLYDLALLIARRGEEIDWRAANDFAQQAGLARPVRAMLDLTRARWGIGLPAQTDSLFHASRFALGERIVYAITTTRFPEAGMLADALEAPGLGSKVQFVRRHLFPDAAYMRTRYAISSDALLPLYYLRRLVETGFKFLRSVWTAFRRK